MAKEDSNLGVIDNSVRCILYELIANAVNYQYWVGKPNIRPNNSGATQMYKLLEISFKEVYAESGGNYKTLISTFEDRLIEHRFPALKNRLRHLEELITQSAEKFAFALIELKKMPTEEPIELMGSFIGRFPGYAEDLFLKRAILFFHQLHRRLGWFSEEISRFPIAADYQIPKMLRFGKCIYYSKELAQKIDNFELIPEGSLMECEIRASSILACKKLAEKVGCTMGKIDNYLWRNHNLCKDPFHLTITTNY